MARPKLNIPESKTQAEIICLIASGINYPHAIAQIRNLQTAPTFKQLKRLEKENWIISKKEKDFNKTIFSLTTKTIILFINQIKKEYTTNIKNYDTIIKKDQQRIKQAKQIKLNPTREESIKQNIQERIKEKTRLEKNLTLLNNPQAEKNTLKSPMMNLLIQTYLEGSNNLPTQNLNSIMQSLVYDSAVIYDSFENLTENQQKQLKFKEEDLSFIQLLNICREAYPLNFRLNSETKSLETLNRLNLMSLSLLTYLNISTPNFNNTIKRIKSKQDYNKIKEEFKIMTKQT